MRAVKNVAVLTEDGAFVLFFRPHPGGFDSSRAPTPGNLPSGGQPRGGRGWGWAQVELTDAVVPLATQAHVTFNHKNNSVKVSTGADAGFFLGGGALVSCSTSTPINHIVFFWAEYQLY